MADTYSIVFENMTILGHEPLVNKPFCVHNEPHIYVVLTPIYYHHKIRNLENTKISLFIRLKNLRNKKKYKRK